MLGVAISVDNLVSGIAGSVFIAFLSGLTNTAYTATQYALFSSIMTLPGKVIGGFSGLMVDELQRSARRSIFAQLLDAVGAAPKFGGYAIFFVYTALLGLPALVLAVIVRRHFKKKPLLPEEGGAGKSATGCHRAGGTDPFRSGAWGLPAGNGRAST